MKTLNFFKQVWQGKSIYRIIMNWEIKSISSNLSGRALDLASGRHGESYREYLSTSLVFETGDIKIGEGVSKMVDFNKALPFSDNYFDVVVFVNALYIVQNRPRTFSEIKRILKHGGKLILVSPFVSNEMPDPDDFCRLTHQGLETELKVAGFRIKKIKRFGERFSSAVYLLDPLWYFKLIKLLIYGLAIFLDKFIPVNVKKLHPVPVGYIILAEN